MTPCDDLVHSPLTNNLLYTRWNINYKMYYM